MTQKLEHLKESPSQTAGPYVHIGATPNFCGVNGVYPVDLGVAMVRPETQGRRVTITGVVYDGLGAPVKDALIEIWQADANGRYPGRGDPRGGADPQFSGWGRKPCDAVTGEWAFETIKPGAVPFKDGRQMAPHITFWIVARGINLGLHTRMYFPEDETEIATDPVLNRIEHRDRVRTLIARSAGEHAYRFDIRLQGESETVFFDI